MADASKIQPSHSKAADAACSWLPDALEKECRVVAAKKEAQQKDTFVFLPASDQKLATSNSSKESKPAASSSGPGEGQSYKAARPFFPWVFGNASSETWLQRITRMLQESFQRGLPNFRVPPNFHFPPRQDPCGNNTCDANETNQSCPADCPPEPPAPFCGDGNVDAGEQCDGGANCDPVTCQTIPEPPAPFCGDGQVNTPDEQCDGAANCDASCHTLPPPPPPSVFDSPITLDQMCQVFPQLSGESQFALGDFNNDGHQDLAVNRPDDGMAYVIMNIQERCASGVRLSLEQAANIVFDSFGLSSGFTSVTTEDVTGDGIPDVSLGISAGLVLHNNEGRAGYLVFQGGSELFNIAENAQITISPTDDQVANQNQLQQNNMKLLLGVRNQGLGKFKNLGDIFGNGRNYTSFGDNDSCDILPKDVFSDGSTVKNLDQVWAQADAGEFQGLHFQDSSLQGADLCNQVHTANISANGQKDFILFAPDTALGHGKIFFIIGQENMPGVIDVANPVGVGMFTISGENRVEEVGLSASIYDYTGDGIADIVLTAPNRAVSVNQNVRGGAGVTYVIPGESIRAALASGAIQPGNNYTISQIVQITGNAAVISSTQENGQFGRKGIAPVVVGHNAQHRPIIKTVVAASEYLPPQGGNVSGCLFVYDQGLQGPQWAEQAAASTIEASGGVQRLGNTLESVDWNGDGEADGIGVTDGDGAIYFRSDAQPSQ